MEWISVKDKMPNDDSPVLLYDNYEILIGRFLYTAKDFPVFGIYSRGQTYNITHWMPLPEPPKQ